MAIQTLTILKILTKMLKITFDDNYKNEDKRCIVLAIGILL
eukprot:14517.XXX_615916_615779_1 [CDS] Oithona nana genome sequencing.